MKGEVFGHQHLEGVVWAWWGNWEADRLRGRLADTGRAASPLLDDVWINSN